MLGIINCRRRHWFRGMTTISIPGMSIALIRGMHHSERGARANPSQCPETALTLFGLPPK